MSVNTILLTSDKNLSTRLYDSFNSDANINFKNVEDLESVSDRIKNKTINVTEYDCIVCDDSSQEINCIELYDTIKNEYDYNIGFIVYDNNIDNELAFKLGKLGISDYINKNSNIKKLKNSILRSADKEYNLCNRYMEVFTDIQHTINKLLDIKDYNKSIDIILDNIKNGLKYDIIGIWTINHKDNKLVPKKVTKEAKENLDNPKPVFNSENSIAYKVYKQNKIKIINDVSDFDDRYNKNTEIMSEAIIPIKDFGIINIASLNKNSFTDREIKVIELWGQVLKSNIDRIRKVNNIESKQQELIKERNRLDNFVSFVTHDIRNPVQIAQGNLRISKNKLESNREDEVEVERIETIDESLNRIEQIIRDIRVLTKHENDKLDIESINLNNMVSNCWNDIDNDQAEIDNRIDLNIEGDRSKLKNVFENLFKNAIHHNDKDIKIIVDNMENGFYVQDTGDGIDENIKSKLFEPGVSTDKTGSGLGLQIIKRIIESHNWNINAENTNKGARFNIYLED